MGAEVFPARRCIFNDRGADAGSCMNDIGTEIQGDIIMMQNAGMIMFIDAVTGNSFCTALADIKAWGIYGTGIYWLNGKGPTFVPSSVNLRNTMKPAQGKEITFHTSDLKPSGIAALDDNSCALLVKATDSSWAVIWENNNQPYLSLMPFGGVHNTSYALNKQYSYFCNSLISTNDLKQCLKLNEKVSEISENRFTNLPEKVIDGFLDECNDKEFVKTEKGRYTVKNLHADKDCPIIYIGIEITEPDLIRKFASTGLDNRTELEFKRGKDAVFTTAANTQPVILNSSSNEEVYSFAYSIAPNGKKCQIEIRIKFPRVMRYPMNYRPTSKKTAFNNLVKVEKDFATSPDVIKGFFGEFAIKLIWSSDFNTQENLLESTIDGPLSFIRFIFTE